VLGVGGVELHAPAAERGVGRILVRRDMANSEADGQSKPFEIAPDTEIHRRAREVQFLLNVVACRTHCLTCRWSGRRRRPLNAFPLRD
jgi:hypothetical protein